jgi:hypothetical protein
MNRRVEIQHAFVDSAPDELVDGTLYVSIPFKTALHKCCCGCGREVVTPLSPARWALTFDGVSVSLYPSIGNWSFPCQSHYWIEGNKIVWDEKWSRREIDRARLADKRDIIKQYEESGTTIKSPGKKLSRFWKRSKS